MSQTLVSTIHELLSRIENRGYLIHVESRGDTVCFVARDPARRQRLASAAKRHDEYYAARTLATLCGVGL